MQVRNAGPGAADVAVADLLPAAIVDPQLSLSGGTGECVIGQVPGAPPGFPDEPVCTIPQFEVGGSRTFTIRGRLAPGTAGTTIENLAAVSGSSVEADFSDNLAQVSFVPGTVDMRIEKRRLGSGPVAVGGEVAFELVVANDGDAPATDVVARDTLPAGLAPLAPPAGCELDGQDVVCRVDRLGPGETRSFAIGARADPAAAGRTLTNHATVTSAVGDADGDPLDNEAGADVTVSPPPEPPEPPEPPTRPSQAPATDVAVRVTGPTGTLRVGDSTRWQLEVTNVSQVAATGVSLSGVASGSARGTTARVSQAACGPQPPAGCDLGTLAPGERRTVAVTLTPERPGTLALAGTVRASQAETRSDNNDDSATVRVREGQTSLAVDVRAPAGVRAAGEEVPITLAVRNRGSRPAVGVSICGRLPRGIGVVRRGGARVRDGRLCWRIARLAPGARRTVRVRAHLSCVPGQRTVVARVRADNASGRTTRARLRIACSGLQPRFTG